MLQVKDERLALSSDVRPDDNLLHELRSAKPAIVAYLGGLACWGEEDWNAFYEARAGIMEFDGGLPRAEAEATATGEVDLLRNLVRASHG
jgi:hypothetical protein